jgi:hypothetical protein
MKKKVNVGNLFDAIEKTLKPSKKPTPPKKPSPKKK